MRRIPWHKPSPTLVAHMATDTYMYIHPEPNTHRTITHRKQRESSHFPIVSILALCRLHPNTGKLENAVPPFMAQAIAQEILDAWSSDMSE